MLLVANKGHFVFREHCFVIYNRTWKGTPNLNMNGHLRTTGGSGPGWTLGHYLQNRKTSESLGHRTESVLISSCGNKQARDWIRDWTKGRVRDLNRHVINRSSRSLLLTRKELSEVYTALDRKVVWVYLCQPCLSTVVKCKARTQFLPRLTLASANSVCRDPFWNPLLSSEIY